MTDKELLELAAKARGIEYNLNYGKGFWVGEYYSGKEWDPLTDDGDALRLAVALRLSFVVMDSHIVIHGFAWPNLVIHEYSGDPYSATRRSIVRAAAEIGKDMK